MSIFSNILEWAREQQLLIQQGEDDIIFQVNGQSGSWMSRVKALEEDGMVLVLCAYPFLVPEEKRADMALALHEISRNLKLGTFYLDEKDGQINFRLGQFLWPYEEEETDQRARMLIMLAMKTTDDYFQKLLMLCEEDSE